jgi:hypothetical protein
MFPKSLFFLLIFSALSHTVKGEDWYARSIVDMALESEQIVIGRFLSEISGDYRFLVRDLNDQNSVLDTIICSNLSNYYDCSSSHTYKNLYSKIEDSDEVILFLSSKSEPVFSGIRLVQDDKIYIPYQPENPGIFTFYLSPDSISWETLKTRINSAFLRTRPIRKILEIQDPVEKSIALSNWLEKNYSSFCFQMPIALHEPFLNQDTGWGMVEFNIWDLISKGNIAKNTWRASQFFFSEHPMRDAGESSFSSIDDFDFLLERALHGDSTREKVQALQFLENACYYHLLNNNASLDSSTLESKRNAVFDLLISSIQDDSLYTTAFNVSVNLSRIYDREKVLLPAFKTVFQKFDRNQFSKISLARYLHYACDLPEWESLTGNQNYLFICPIQHFIKDEQLGIDYRSDTNFQPIYCNPYLVCSELDGKRINIKISDSEFEIQAQKGNIIWIDLDKIPSGNWSIHIEGTAGKNHEYKWQSLTFEFTK